MKVQDGCMLRCSFCIIPYVRPQLTSRPVEHILDEVRRLVDNGYREVVLTGIHLGHYGVEWNRQRARRSDEWSAAVASRCAQIAELPGDFRVRLSSIEATEVTRELIDVMADHGDKVCPHLHISMQSGSDSVLRRMRRRWGSRRFVDRCRLVQERLDRPAITTDIIVGFPRRDRRRVCGDDRYCAGGRLLEDSHLPVQPAPRHAGGRDAEIRCRSRCSRRSRELAAVEAELRDAYYRSLIGRKLRVLVEGREQGAGSKGRGAGTWHGTSCRYATVELAATAADEGRFVDVMASEVCGDRIVACDTAITSLVLTL